MTTNVKALIHDAIAIRNSLTHPVNRNSMTRIIEELKDKVYLEQEIQEYLAVINEDSDYEKRLLDEIADLTLQIEKMKQ